MLTKLLKAPIDPDKQKYHMECAVISFSFCALALLLMLWMRLSISKVGQSEKGSVTVQIPYIKGIPKGTACELEIEMSSRADPGYFEYRQNGGMVILEVAIIT